MSANETEPVTVSELTAYLDDVFGGHLDVFVEDKAGRRHRMEVIDTTDYRGTPCVVLRAIGDRIDE
jgi:hypothetical protein